MGCPMEGDSGGIIENIYGEPVRVGVEIQRFFDTAVFAWIIRKVQKNLTYSEHNALCAGPPSALHRLASYINFLS